MKRGFVVVTGTALIGVVLVAVALAREPAARRVVEMRGFAFQPARVTVSVGDTIEFVNRDALPHTATATGGAWDSGEMGASARWTRVVTEPGEIAYFCAYHPTMRGTIEVLD